MMEIEAFMKVVERIEEKIDDIRDKLHETIIMTHSTGIKQLVQENEVKELKQEVANLKSAYDRATGAWKLLSLPGILSALYVLFQALGK